jgi:ATP-dependent RNA helicase RhlB
MNNPVEIEIEPDQITVESVVQSIYHVSSDEKMKLLLGVIAKENPKNALVFTNTKRMAEIVSFRLGRNGFKSEFIMGDLPQNKRLRIIDRMKNGDIHILVATDVAARGIHIDNLDLVVNYDLPEDPENYVHRIGRTARAGNTGKAISLVCERYVYSLETIERLIKMKLDVSAVDDSMFVSDVSGPMPHHEKKRLSDAHREGRKSVRSGGRPARPEKPVRASAPPAVQDNAAKPGEPGTGKKRRRRRRGKKPSEIPAAAVQQQGRPQREPQAPAQTRDRRGEERKAPRTQRDEHRERHGVKSNRREYSRNNKRADAPRMEDQKRRPRPLPETVFETKNKKKSILGVVKNLFSNKKLFD